MTVEYECSDFNEFTCFFRWRGTVLCAAAPAPLSHHLWGEAKPARSSSALLALPPTCVCSSPPHPRARRPAVLCRPPIWALLALHCALLYLHRELGIDAGMIVHVIVKGSVPDDVSRVTTNFLIFFLVYYGGQCYKRYYDMYFA